MSRISSKGAMGQKADKQPKDPAYLSSVRTLPCVICDKFDMTQNTASEAHHCKSGRYSFAKAPDRMAIPLCHGHHLGMWVIDGEEAKVAYHNRQEVWEKLFGPDTDYIEQTQDIIDNW
jgi:hypothetical protein